MTSKNTALTGAKTWAFYACRNCGTPCVWNADEFEEAKNRAAKFCTSSDFQFYKTDLTREEFETEIIFGLDDD